MDHIAGYVASILIGISLGLIGGGGSILTVPVLVYLFHIEPPLATAYSLFIVGTTSLVGGLRCAWNKAVDFRVAAIFAAPSLAAVYLTRRYILPAIPERIDFASLSVSRDTGIMVLFASIMFAAAVAMIRKQNQSDGNPDESTCFSGRILIEGAVVGFLTGLVGAGGGFLIIPALVLFAGLSMEKAIGTSLFIIAAKSLIGFLGDIGSGQPVNFVFLGAITTIATCGIFVGLVVSRRIAGFRLKEIFGWFVLFIGVSVVIMEIVR